MIASDYLLLPLSTIRPTEEVCPARVDEVVAMILECQAWTQPICAEETIHALLDGHHRLAAARQLELARIPVHVFDYADVELASWRPDVTPTRAEVLTRALNGELYPHKTTRHTFPERPMLPLPLEVLIDQPADRIGLRARDTRRGAAVVGSPVVPEPPSFPPTRG